MNQFAFRTRWVACMLCVLAGCTALPATAEPGVTAQKISLGMSAPLTGPLSAYGTELQRGLKLGFAQANAAGGLGGREVELLVKDDAGDPTRALANTRALLQAGVFALTGYHGAGAIEAVLPLVEQEGVPLVGVASSAETLREPPRRLVFNLRAGAREEAAAMVLQLDAVGLSEVAIIAQDDALGRAALDGIRTELARLALRPTALVRIPPAGGAAAIAQAVKTACGSKALALVLVLDARNAMATIRAARASGCQPQFYVTSEAGAQLLAGGGPAGELAGVVVSQVVPHPFTASLPVVADYQRLLAESGPGLQP
ncbi:MAG TPA: ABC transporter substrate-binding protein, partial [Ramlibacter sp.]|nr:ABC transporter substrate-binding protein [Ramlibacter sp.]